MQCFQIQNKIVKLRSIKERLNNITRIEVVYSQNVLFNCFSIIAFSVQMEGVLLADFTYFSFIIIQVFSVFKRCVEKWFFVECVEFVFIVFFLESYYLFLVWIVFNKCVYEFLIITYAGYFWEIVVIVSEEFVDAVEYGQNTNFVFWNGESNVIFEVPRVLIF